MLLKNGEQRIEIVVAIVIRKEEQCAQYTWHFYAEMDTILKTRLNIMCYSLGNIVENRNRH